MPKLISATVQALALALVLMFAAAPNVGARDQTIDVTSDDAEMNAAIAKARASLPDFWKARENPPAGVDGFALKVAIPYANNSREHFWLSTVERVGDRFAGTIDNDPNHATHVKRGQRYEFDEASITDWLYMRNGKFVGNETMRPLLKRMPPEQADRYRAMYETP